MFRVYEKIVLRIKEPEHYASYAFCIGCALLATNCDLQRQIADLCAARSACAAQRSRANSCSRREARTLKEAQQASFQRQLASLARSDARRDQRLAASCTNRVVTSTTS